MSDARDPIPPPPSDAREGKASDPAGAADTHRPGWVARSDEHARPVLERIAHFEPEIFAPLGVPGTSEKIIRLWPDWPGRKLAAHDEAIRALGEQRSRESHPAVRIDLESMITFLRREADLERLEDALMIPCPNLAQTIVLGLHGLLAGRSTKDQEAAACRRLRLYAGLEDAVEPLANQAEALVRDRLCRGGGGLLGPWREALLHDLRTASRLLAQLPQLLGERRIASHETALGVLRGQLGAYEDFLRQEVLPRCRDDFRLPPELYAARLEKCGIELPAAELSHRAESAFGEIRRQLDATARRLAKRRGWRDEHFPGVRQRLMRERLDPGEILDHYDERHRQLEELIATTRFASLAGIRRFDVRLASAAESAFFPFPHFRWPAVFDNPGEAGEIVLPLMSAEDRTTDLPGDPYASRALSWSVAAHEGLPGHALQIGRLLAPDAPLARGPLAFNYASVEGWAVYAESEISPDLPLEARFVTLHSQLRRAAGAFLDPGLQQGRFTPEQARCCLREQVGLTARETDQALWRYTVWSPGQATSYFYGHMQLAALRTAVECRLGPAFDRREYHDFLLAQGLLPLALLRRWVVEHFGTQRRLAA